MSKLGADRNQKILLDLATQPGNDVCADCKSRIPRWASANLGIFICMKCASVHRKIGTHVSKVKSLTMDTWTKEQIEVMKQYGNIKSNQIYHPDERRHPPPTNMMESERDSELEKFIRDKYEFKKFKPSPASVAASLLGPSRSAAQARLAMPPTRSMTTSPSGASIPTSSSSSTLSSNPAPGTSSVPPQSQPQVPYRSATMPPPASLSTQSVQAPLMQTTQSSSPAFNDLLSLQAPSMSSSLPLQYSPLPTPSTLQSGISAGFGQPQLGSSGFGSMNGGMGGMSSMGGAGTSPYGYSAGGSTSAIGAMNNFSSPPSAMNPFQQQQQPGMNSGGFVGLQQQSFSNGGMSGMTGISGMSGMSGMNPFQSQQLMQQQQQLAQPTAFASQAGTNPFGALPGSTFLSPHSGPGPSASPQFMATTPSFAPSSSPNFNMGPTSGMNPFAGMTMARGPSPSPQLQQSSGMGIGMGMGTGSNMVMGMGTQTQPSMNPMNPFGQMQAQTPYGAQPQQPYGQQQAGFGNGQQGAFGQQQGPFGQQPSWNQQQGW